MLAGPANEIESLRDHIVYHVMLYANFTYSLSLQHYQDAGQLEEISGENLKTIQMTFKMVNLYIQVGRARLKDIADAVCKAQIKATAYDHPDGWSAFVQWRVRTLWRICWHSRLLKLSLVSALVATICGLSAALYNITKVRQLAWLAVAFVLGACVCDVTYLILASHSGLMDAEVWETMRRHYNERGFMDVRADTPMATSESQFLTTLDQGQEASSAWAFELKRIQLNDLAYDIVRPLFFILVVGLSP